MKGKKRLARKFWHLGTATTLDLKMRPKPPKGVRYLPTTTPLAYTVPIIDPPEPVLGPPWPPPGSEGRPRL
jgi:hypothetical protein